MRKREPILKKDEGAKEIKKYDPTGNYQSKQINCARLDANRKSTANVGLYSYFFQITTISGLKVLWADFSACVFLTVLPEFGGAKLALAPPIF